MSKRLKEVFANMFHVSFLETIERDPCDINGTMEIIIEELTFESKAKTIAQTRYVKVCNSQKKCIHYEVPIDATTGIGRLSISNIQELEHVVVQVEEDGTQMINKDMVQISYEVNGVRQEEDYASLQYTSNTNTHHQCVRIINQELASSELTIYKELQDENEEVLPLENDMKFLVCIHNERGFEKYITLDYKNNFREVVDCLKPGFYTIEECEYALFEPFYSLNNARITSDNRFDLVAGHNELQVINVKRSDTQLTIQKDICNRDGELCKPTPCELYQVRVISALEDKMITLCEENDFCVTLFGLECGYYDICEVCQGDVAFDISYVVNDEEECEHAHLEIRECEHAFVNIINTMIPLCEEEQPQQNSQEAPLRICKFIRKSEGCIVKPSAACQFKVNVIGCGINQTFLLNNNNNFCVDILDLCNGEYEICEVSEGDYSTSYIINDEREKTSACICVRDEVMNCVAIINEERNKGTLCISKYVCNEFGDLMKPDKDQSFCVTLSSYFYKKCVCLDAHNDWTMCFKDLRFGSYEVREEDPCDYLVSYIVDCERERVHARVVIDDSFEHDIKIINHVNKQISGVLKISKYEETASKELVKPCCDEEFEVEVEGACFCETYILKASNNWCIMLEGLESGEYHIQECNANEYEVSYLVNREVQENAMVCLNEGNQEVCIINHQRKSGTLKIAAQFRDCSKNIGEIQHHANIHVVIEGNDETYKTCLQASNHWCSCMEELPCGKYRIIQSDNLGYKVSYCVNGIEENFGRITLGCEDEEVIIFNEETPCTGLLKVTKFIEDQQGNLNMPCAQEEFHFELSGRCFSRTYTLRQRNDFCVYFDDLDEGVYEVKELDKESQVCYQINGECQPSAKFTLGLEDMHVDIINQQIQYGSLHIEKRIRKGSSLCLPKGEDCFQVLLKGKGVHEIIELNADNAFSACIDNLQKQHYEIKEVQTTSHAQYDINGCLHDDGYFLYEGEDVSITIINEEIQNGCMEITKQMEDENGHLMRPNRCEYFHILVESDCYKKKIELNNENDFCVRLYDLPLGHYEVSELDCDTYVSYLINGQPYESACVDVCEEDVSIRVINHLCAKGCLQFHGIIEENGMYYEPENQDEFHLTIRTRNELEEVVLDCSNEFSHTLCDLLTDSYTISENGCEHISFEIDGQVFDDVVCVELGQDHICINVIKHVMKLPNITIEKCIRNQQGTLCSPCPNESFDVTLLYKGKSQCICLNEANNWTQTLENQCAGMYEINEINGGSGVCYQIDDKQARTNGTFEVHEEDVHVTIINTLPILGTLCLEACVQSDQKELCVPCEDMIFYMNITACDYQKTLVLNASNCWKQEVELEINVMYTIEQKNDPCFSELYYLVDDQKESKVCLMLQEGCQEVCSVNVFAIEKGALTITKYIRNCECGCERKPYKEEVYLIEVTSEDIQETIRLDAQNHWEETLCELPYGWYEIREIKEENVCYVVNGESETREGKIQICREENKVKIINEEQTIRKGNIELCKLIKDAEGCYRYPSPSESYAIKIVSDTTTSNVLLNYANHFYASIRNLADGWYEVIEESGSKGVAYVVNNATPTNTGCVHVLNNSNTVNIINPCEEIGGSIKLTKVIETLNGSFEPPKKGSYRIHISKPRFNKVVTLSKENQYTTSLTQLEQGTYVVDEIDHDDTSYIVNSGSRVDYAIVQVENNANSVQVINKTKSKDTGSITMAKYLRVKGQLIRPTGNESYVFLVSKPQFNQLYTLDRNNNWMLTISDLANGDYVVNETTTASSVSYIINGGSERDRAVVEVRNNSNTLQIINSKVSSKGSIRIEKYMRDETGELVRPLAGFEIQIRVSSPTFNEVYILKESNQWTQQIENLTNGQYVIDELNSNLYTTFMINGGSEVNRGIVEVTDNANQVTIINHKPQRAGTLELKKFIKNSDGSVMLPADGDTFIVEIKNDTIKRRIILDDGNGFHAICRDLQAGTYSVREIVQDNYLPTYRVNGGPIENHANVTMADGVNNKVEIFNELKENLNTIEVFKYMLDADGNYTPPATRAIYKFDIIGDNGRDRYELTPENDWYQRLINYPSGIYQIKEVGSPYQVQYFVNSEELLEEAIFTTSAGMTNVIGIVNKLSQTSVGSIVLTKRIHTSTNTSVIPKNGESFTMHVTSDNFDQYVSLNPDNGYTHVLQDLSFGDYLIEEEPTDYLVSFKINGAKESDVGRVSVNDEEENKVEIINTKKQGTTNTSASIPNHKIKIVIE
ncbi:MAG: hypothetical protein RR481_05635 [Longicatena sp.]